MLRNLMLKRWDKDENNKLISFSIDDAIWTKIKDLKNIELNALPFYDDRYIKKKRRAFGDKVYTNFRGLNVPEADIECELFYIHFYWLFAFIWKKVLVYENKYYLQVYLDNKAYNKVCTCSKKINENLSDWKYCWRLDIINWNII